MMQSICDSVYRIPIRFENIETSAFLLQAGDALAIADSGASPEDAERYILPEVAALGGRVAYLVASHLHGDHYGGMARLAREYPEAELIGFAKGEAGMRGIEDGALLLGRFALLNLPGHTPDSLAILDGETKTLLSFDCFQLGGVGRYGTGVTDGAAYFSSIARARALGLCRLVASHEYYPLGMTAEGAAAVADWLDACRRMAEDLADFAEANAMLGEKELSREFLRQNPLHPPVGFSTFDTLRQRRRT